MIMQWDRGSRYFFIGLVLMTCLVIISTGMMTMKQAESMKAVLLSHDSAVASALMEAGVSSEIIAKALTSTVVSDDGSHLLRQMGQLESMSYTNADDLSILIAAGITRRMPGTILWGMVMLGGGYFFIERRERLFKSVTHQLQSFMEGNYHSCLPSLDEGGLYKMFAAIDELASTLSAKNDAEREAKQFLKAMLSDISHQLKTPLTALSMYNEIILDEPENVTAVTSFSKKIDHTLTHMSQLIQALLKITRLDAGSVHFEQSVYTVRELAEQAVDPLMLRAEKEEKRIILDIAPDITLYCDLMWTREAIANIVKNALDYSERGMTVTLTCEKTATAVRLMITDNGPGIAPESIYHVFKRFYRQPKAKETQGVGLGLSLSKAITEGQGGVLTVQSTLGEGSTFSMTFLTEM
ncbi:HAMP domain-containing histidine kinase [Fusibacter paucivorans]|uniref:histidine kinase n=1 Tax=Fusibacter paucivorans TaxID=76009 RepID=A0ABS5PKF6_9FIRM|nr:HAMP domain-containing sensor histidine kinase [Fusibacter paucivorans]MBS7525583.1 HAMP domain-containing histidine kinase [Fusibacter paucivorans]